jgi:hypothetical protein
MLENKAAGWRLLEKNRIIDSSFPAVPTQKPGKGVEVQIVTPDSKSDGGRSHT